MRGFAHAPWFPVQIPSRLAGLVLGCAIFISSGCAARPPVEGVGKRGASASIGKRAAVPTPPPLTSSTPVPTNGYQDAALCSSADYKLQAGYNGALGGVEVDANVVGTKATSCRVERTVTLSLADGSGRLLTVKGNPVTAQIDALVSDTGAQPRKQALFVWQNWCNTSETHWQLDVATTDQRATTGLQQAVPVCINSEEPSTLEPFGNNG